MTPQQHQDRLDDLAWMYVGGECAAGAAQRLGIRYNALEKWVTRHDVQLWRRLAARNPLPIDKVQAEKVFEQHARWVREGGDSPCLQRVLGVSAGYDVRVASGPESAVTDPGLRPQPTKAE